MTTVAAADPFAPLSDSERTPQRKSAERGLSRWTPILPVPQDAPPPPVECRGLGLHVASWRYVDSKGRTLTYERRFLAENGEKQTRPLTFAEHSDTGRRAWRWMAPPAPRPMYGLERLAAYPEAAVLLCEGPKTAEAASALWPDLVAVATFGGAGGVGHADVSPLAGRDVTIWPDADEPGRRFARIAASLAIAKGAASVRVVRVPTEMREGWDLADPPPPGWDAARLRELLDAAEACDVKMISDGDATEQTTGKQPAEGEDPKPRREEKTPTQSTLLVELAESLGLRFVQTSDGEAFVITPVGGHVETLPLRGRRGFDAWLKQTFYRREGKAASAQSVNDALGALEMRCLHGEVVTVSVRLAGCGDGRLYLDLGAPDWRVVEVTATGWRIIEGAESPVYFRRPAGLLPLQVPERGGSLLELRPFVNAGDDASWRLLAGWLVAALRASGPYPLLVLLGEQGSAKSTTARTLRRLIDPNRAELRAEPRSEDDLVLAATNGWVVCVDNVSSLQPWLSDALCRISTGGGLGKRKLFTDGDESLFDVARPMLLNGIGDIVSRPDLLDRAFLVTLPRIPEGRRRREAGFWRDFTAAQPRILGALLDAVVVAIRDEEQTATTLGALPRMADAACWIEAAAPALGWGRGEFLDSYRGNRDEAHELALETSPVAAAILALLDKRVDSYSGTATELLEALAEHASESARRSKGWPSNGRSLSNVLQRLAPTLRAVGVEVDQARSLDRARRRLWLLSCGECRELRPQRPDRPNVNESSYLRADEAPEASSACGPASSGAPPTADARRACGRNADATRNPLTPRQGSVSDGADGLDDPAGTLSMEDDW